MQLPVSPLRSFCSNSSYSRPLELVLLCDPDASSELFDPVALSAVCALVLEHLATPADTLQWLSCPHHQYPPRPLLRCFSSSPHLLLPQLPVPNDASSPVPAQASSAASGPACGPAAAATGSVGAEGRPPSPAGATWPAPCAATAAPPWEPAGQLHAPARCRVQRWRGTAPTRAGCLHRRGQGREEAALRPSQGRSAAGEAQPWGRTDARVCCSTAQVGMCRATDRRRRQAHCRAGW